MDIIKDIGLDIEGDNQTVVMRKESDTHKWKFIAISPKSYVEIGEDYWIRDDYKEAEKVPNVILV